MEENNNKEQITEAFGAEPIHTPVEEAPNEPILGDEIPSVNIPPIEQDESTAASNDSAAHPSSEAAFSRPAAIYSPVTGKKYADFDCPYLADYPKQAKKCPHLKKLKTQKIILWSVIAVIEAALIAFASLGIYFILQPGNRINGGFSSQQGPQNLIPDFSIPGWNDNQSSRENRDSSAQENTVTKARLGLTCYEVPESVANMYGWKRGLMVKSVENGSDAQAKGVQPNDIIYEIDGKSITSFDDYYDVMEEKQAGDTAKLSIFRPDTQNNKNNTILTLEIKLIANNSYKEGSRSSEKATSSETNSFPKF